MSRERAPRIPAPGTEENDMSKPRVFHSPRVPVKPTRLAPVELSDAEVEGLMRAFIQGKTEIVEDDAMTLLCWATRQRMGALLVDMIIRGEIQPIVKGHEVFVALPGHYEVPV
jgi:hypothetical protein